MKILGSNYFDRKSWTSYALKNYIFSFSKSDFEFWVGKSDCRNCKTSATIYEWSSSCLFGSKGSSISKMPADVNCITTCKEYFELF
jgi:hypothetical protein